MSAREIYEKSYLFLVEESEPIITKEEIDEFISESDITECKDIKTAFVALIERLQDFNRYTNIIRFQARKETILNVLHDGDLKHVVSMSPEELLDRFKNAFGFKKDIIWFKYSKSIISGAKFLSSFNDDTSFKKTFDSCDANSITREAFALYLSHKIYNMGFASACNWLKEIGYRQYVKPDLHIRNVCAELNLISKDNKDDVDCYEAMISFANNAGVEPYKVDKVWWLICTGNFYRLNKKLDNPRDRKNRFLKKIKEKWLYEP